MSTQEAALELRVSETTVKRLVRRGTLHTTKPKKLRGHWASFIIVDKAFKEEQHRRLHGLKSPRRKHTPDTDSVQKEFVRKAREERLNEICERWCKDDPSPIQTVTPEEEALEKCRNAMNICLEAQKACSADKELAENAMGICNVARKDCQDKKDSITRKMSMVDSWVNEWIARLDCSEGVYTRCTAILATACILQLLLAAYYILCHFNVL